MKRNHPKCRGYTLAKECYFSETEFSISLLESQEFGQRLEIKRIFPHDMFNYDLGLNDIALIELASPLKCSIKTYPICLATKEEMYKDGQNLIIAGWGWNRPQGVMGPKILREGVMKQIPSSSCVEEHSHLPEETVHQYHCAVGTNQSVCRGDSGSSTFIKFQNRFYSLGVTSHTDLKDKEKMECVPTLKSTFSKVLYFLKWIMERVKDLPVALD
ncbi:tryptase beta-2 [Nephila pilipes]|uniref:Tryptase beta-2 n=1 Tax=Nephila pilipes TaxID=299642 RepID=A0A8X6TXT0_NEPPI|nr:tryptase beta-2 [Nephila pilipes]